MIRCCGPCGLAAGDFCLAALRHKPGDDALPVIALDLDHPAFARSACTTITLERLSDFFGFVRGQTVDEAYDAGAPALARDANHAVGGHCGFGHTKPLRMARVCIFCGAHAGTNAAYRQLAAGVAQALQARGLGLVYGGGRVGLMGSLADAMLALGGEVIGVIPRGLANDEVAHTGVEQLRVVESMHERKALMAELSDAFIALPGGYGTMDEFHEILTWRQLRIIDKPIGLLNSNGYYDDLLALYARMRDEGFIARNGRELFVSALQIETLFEAMHL